MTEKNLLPTFISISLPAKIFFTETKPKVKNKIQNREKNFSYS